jgi:hypothetical protein
MSDDSDYPRIAAANSLYMYDAYINKDAEYHMQCVEIAKDKYQVNLQFGRRGAKLTHQQHHKGLVMSRYSAMDAMETHIRSKKAKGYKPIDLSCLHGIYERLIAGGLDRNGVDLYMERDRKTISMLEYINNAGEAARDSLLSASAFAAKAKMTAVMAKIGRAPVIDQKMYVKCAVEAQASLTIFGLQTFGVFLGHTDALGTVVKGIPPPPSVAIEEEKQEVAKPARRASP